MLRRPSFRSSILTQILVRGDRKDVAGGKIVGVVSATLVGLCIGQDAAPFAGE